MSIDDGAASTSASDPIVYGPRPPAGTTAPVVRAPAGSVIAPSVLGSETVPVRVTWPAATHDSAITRYELQHSVNGGPFTAVELPSATSRAGVVNATPGSQDVFRVCATDGANNVSAFATSAVTKVAVIQEDAAGVVYAGTWTRVALEGASAGFVKHASASTARARLTFTGRGVAVAMTMGKDRGKVAVFIDGVLSRTVDLYSATTNVRHIAFAAPVRWGTHTVELRVLGTRNAASTGDRVDLDAIVVTQ
jgi:hypothetical protein